MNLCQWLQPCGMVPLARAGAELRVTIPAKAHPPELHCPHGDAVVLGRAAGDPKS